MNNKCAWTLWLGPTIALSTRPCRARLNDEKMQHAFLWVGRVVSELRIVYLRGMKMVAD